MKNLKKIFESSNFQIFINLKIRKKSQSLISHFFKKATLELKNEIIYIKEDLLEEFNLQDFEELEDYLLELLDYKIKIKTNDMSKTFGVLSSYELNSKILKIKISDIFWKNLSGNLNYNGFNLDVLPILVDEHVLKLFLTITNFMKIQTSFTLSIGELRTQMGLEDKYSRDNDFIDKILKPALNSINQLLYYKVDITKIKISKSYYNIVFSQNISLSKEKIVFLFKIFEEFSTFFEIERVMKLKILKYLQEYSGDYVYNNLLYASKNLNNGYFQKNLDSIISKNLANYTEKNIIDDNILFENKMKFKNKSLFISWVTNELLKYDINMNFSNISMCFLRIIYFKNEFSFEENGFKINCYFKENYGYLKIQKN